MSTLQQPLKLSCELCDYSSCKKSDFEKHLQTKKHLSTICQQKSTATNAPIFFCEKCDYTTTHSKYFSKHLKTVKHKTEPQLQKSQKVAPHEYSCENCGKLFKDRSGLWRHNKKKCSQQEVSSEKELVSSLITAQNNNMEKLTNMILELCKNGIVNTTNSHNNNNNSQFNLNFFLNETCKNAMNLTDFVDSIKLQVSDLERIGEEGFVEGMSNIIISNLNNLDETIRPIHCTDKKRETIYIKDENVWSKDENQMKMRNTIKKLANKNIRMLPQYREKYPEHKNSYSKQSDIYDKLIIEVMSTSLVNEDKIIKKITNATTIKKTTT